MKKKQAEIKEQKSGGCLPVFIALILISSVGSCFGKKSNTEIATQPIATVAETTAEITTTESIPETSPIESTRPNPETLLGRGRSDSGRNEPEYKGITGYVALYDHSNIKNSDDCFNTPWLIPTYEKDKQFWVESGSVEHKTEVTVLEQELNHDGWGIYSGYLLVSRVDTGEQFYIDVKNFITRPYWTFDNPEDAADVGYYIAEFNQVSDYYPESSNGKVELSDQTKVLVTGRSHGDNARGYVVEAIVFKEWSEGYGGVSVIFDPSDLTIIY